MRIVFMGTPDFAVPVLQKLVDGGYHVVAVVTQPDRPKGRKKILTPPPVKIQAEKHHIPVYQPEKIREPEQSEKMLAFEPDLIVTAAYGQILPNAILERPKYSCINVHASLLPEYRGGAPIHQAIIDGKKESGVTIMYMVEKLDAGDMLAQAVVPIAENDHVGSLHDKLSEAGASLLLETLPKLTSGELEATPQNQAKATFAANIRREQELINWTKNGAAIYNQIRGLHPWPVAYTYYQGRILKIWWAEKTTSGKAGQPGEVIAVNDEDFVVQTGDDMAIRVTEMQPAGKKRMSTAQFLKGVSMVKGVRLGE